MPNWCQNTLTVTGPAQTISEMLETVKIPDEQEGTFEFSHLIPEDEINANHPYAGLASTIGAGAILWGTRTSNIDDPCDRTDYTCESGEKYSVVCWVFDTAWSPPEGVAKAIVARWPDLTVGLAADEGGNIVHCGILVSAAPPNDDVAECDLDGFSITDIWVSPTSGQERHSNMDVQDGDVLVRCAQFSASSSAYVEALTVSPLGGTVDPQMLLAQALEAAKAGNVSCEAFSYLILSDPEGALGDFESSLPEYWKVDYEDKGYSLLSWDCHKAIVQSMDVTIDEVNEVFSYTLSWQYSDIQSVLRLAEARLRELNEPVPGSFAENLLGLSVCVSLNDEQELDLEIVGQTKKLLSPVIDGTEDNLSVEQREHVAKRLRMVKNIGDATEYDVQSLVSTIVATEL